MSVKLTWQGDPTVVITSFVISVSTDKGQTFNELATIPFSTVVGAPNYNQQTKQFFYVDSAGVPGNIYGVEAVGANGTSVNEFVLAPPDGLPMCTVFGYVLDGFGSVDTGTPVYVTTIGTKGERWVKVPGISAQAPMALGISAASRTVYPDANGVWQTTLIQGVYAKIEIPSIDFSWSFQVPAIAGPINVRDIQQLRGADLGVFPSMDGSRSNFPES